MNLHFLQQSLYKNCCPTVATKALFFSDEVKDENAAPSATETEHTTVFTAVAVTLFGVEVGLIVLLDLVTLPKHLQLLRRNLQHLWTWEQ